LITHNIKIAPDTSRIPSKEDLTNFWTRIAAAEVKHAIHKLLWASAPGFDNITYVTIKKIYKRYLPLMNAIFQDIGNVGYYTEI
jgi:hypothetical protein